jgi:hypothetical protein
MRIFYLTAYENVDLYRSKYDHQCLNSWKLQVSYVYRFYVLNDHLERIAFSFKFCKTNDEIPN